MIRHRTAPWAFTACVLLLAAGCGGGHGHAEPVPLLAELEIENQTDLVPPLADVTFFEIAPAGTPDFTGDLLAADVLPGEIHFLGTFVPDFYDAFAELDLGLSGVLEFFDVLLEGGFVTTFEIF